MFHEAAVPGKKQAEWKSILVKEILRILADNIRNDGAKNVTQESFRVAATVTMLLLNEICNINENEFGEYYDKDA